MLETCLVDADVETVLLACSDGWPSHSNGQCAFESATSPHVGLGHWLSESSSLLSLTKVRRVFYLTSRSSESRNHSLTAMTNVVDQNKHYSDQTAKGPWCFLDRRQSDKGSDLPLLFLFRKALIDFRKHTDRSWYHQVTRMHTGTLGKKNLQDNVFVCMFLHSSTKINNDLRKRETLSEKFSFRDISKQARATSQLSPWSLDKFLISDCVCVGHSGRPRACGPRATLVTYTYAVRW